MREDLAGVFTVPEVPAVVPEIWAFPQLIYGNWNSMGVQPPVEGTKEVTYDAADFADIWPEWDWIPADIVPGEIVVLYARENDKYTLMLDEHPLWVAVAVQYDDTARYNFEGKFFWNVARDGTVPWRASKKSQKVCMEEWDLLATFQDKRLKCLGAEELTVVRESLKQRPKFAV